MAGSWNTSARGNPRESGRTGSWNGLDSASLGIIGLVCAIAGFFALGIVLGPAAIVCGWLSMGRTWNFRGASVPALVAVVLGAIDTVMALLWLTGLNGGGAL
ncbi:small hydrophobic protein [Streptomyces zingiberis]|uniref:Small hydrophobic protein n=1 Tax=Streptomyces zingiberis TaxID=2053010 RepID=A0ABX1BY11_9ACTN|nr:small hydrophobic protein [Streptomyces zingiberis]NJP99553.1 small hydrophobic protein [Streptomyces zingiberis]